MSDNHLQNFPLMQNIKGDLDVAVSRLEKAAEGELVSPKKLDSLNAELVAAREEIKDLKESNKLVSARLDGAINKIKRILGN